MDYKQAYLQAQSLADTITESASAGKPVKGLGGRKVNIESLDIPDMEDVQRKYMGIVKSIRKEEPKEEEITTYLGEGMSDSEQAPSSSSRPRERYDPSKGDYNSVKNVDGTVAKGIAETAEALGMDPEVLATIISYETSGTFSPTKKGPTTKWGQHKGLIQFGEVQAKQYGVDFSNPETALRSQLGPDGAVARYFKENGWKPGMSELDAYSIVNAGGPGLHSRSDTAAGGAPGTVKDKVFKQFGPHRRKARALMETYL